MGYAAYPASMVTKAVRMYLEDRLSSYEIARRLSDGNAGPSAATIQNWVKARGHKLRNRGEAMSLRKACFVNFVTPARLHAAVRLAMAGEDHVAVDAEGLADKIWRALA